MAGLGDMARMFAAGGGGGGMGADAGSPDMESQDPNAPEEGPEMGQGDPDDQLNQGISMIESALDGLPGDIAEKARTHLEALKELAAQAEASEGPQQEQSEQEGPEANAGALEQAPGSGPSVGGSPMSPGA